MVQYLEKHSRTSYITTAFMLASRYPELEVKIHKSTTTCRGCTHDSVHQTHELTYMIGHTNAHLCL